MRFHVPVLAFALAATAVPAAAAPENYAIDESHTFVTFEISHIGYAWIPGTFNDVKGTFTYDPENRSDSSASFTIKTASFDTEHAKRDKHLRSEEFFNVKKYPEATFESTGYEPTGENTAVMRGELTIKGTTRTVEWQVKELHAGVDPWENFRRSFEARTKIDMRDFNIDEYGLPDVSQVADVRVAVEGLRQ